MDKIYYNKLCRDNVPEIIRGKGFECDVHEMDHDEYREQIVRKVLEEARGVANHLGRESLMNELADLQITIEAVKKEFGISQADMEKAVANSIEEKGGFEERLFLLWSSDTTYTSRDQNREVEE